MRHLLLANGDKGRLADAVLIGVDRVGDMNLYAPNGEYGFVEISHLALPGAILGLARGWPVGPAA